MIEAGLIAARALHFAAAMVLFGLALFPLYGYPAGSGAPPVRVTRWLGTSIRCATLLGLLSALAWAWFAIAGMTGTMSAAADADTLFTVVRETGFGQTWVGRLGLLAALLAFVAGSGAERHWLILPVAAVLLATLALVGHTQTNDGPLRVVHVTADGAHLLAAGAWLGGLLALGYVLMLERRLPSAEHTAHAVGALVRFSGMGYAAVAILISSGLINAWVLVGSPERLIATRYGQLLLMKVCLLVGMLVLAAQNHFRLVPALQRSKEPHLQAESPLRVLRRNVLGEQMLGLAIVVIVGWLGTLPPAFAVSE